MASLSGYFLTEIVTPQPDGSGGIALNENFRALADGYNSGILTDGSRGFTAPVSGQNAVAGYDLATLAQITAAQVGSGLPYWNAGELRGSPINGSSPAYTNVLMWNGSEWAPSGLSAGLDGSLYSLVDGTRGYTGSVSGVSATAGYELATLNQIPPSSVANYTESPRLIHTYAPHDILFVGSTGIIEPLYLGPARRTYYEYPSDESVTGIILTDIMPDYNGTLRIKYLWSAHPTGGFEYIFTENPEVSALDLWDLYFDFEYGATVELSGHYEETPPTGFLFLYNNVNGSLVSSGYFGAGPITFNLNGSITGTVQTTWDGLPGGIANFLLTISGNMDVNWQLYIESVENKFYNTSIFNLVSGISDLVNINSGIIMSTEHDFALSSGLYSGKSIRLALTRDGGTLDGIANLYSISLFDRL